MSIALPPDFPVRLAEPWLACRAAHSPSRPALLVGDRCWTYAALHAWARGLAAGLGRAGVAADEPVAVLLDNSAELVALCHALRYRGAVLLPLNRRLQTGEWVAQLRRAEVRWLVHAAGDEAARAAAVEAGTASLVLADGERLLPVGPVPPPRRRSRADAALLRGAWAVLYTSGTSGRPKGVVLGPEALLASASAAVRHLGGTADDRWLACLPLYHVAGLSMLLRSALLGATLEVQARFDAGRLAAVLARGDITQLSLVPTMLLAALDAGAVAAPPLRCVLVGGGPAAAGLLDRARDRGFPVAATYGLTEAASQVATALPGGPRGAGLQPLPGNALRIVAPGSAAPTVALAAGEPGEVWVRGPTLMRGYLGDQAATRGALVGGYLRTGDIGSLDAGGALTLVDRRDDLIVSGGENVYPAEVEAVLVAHPGVREVAVVGRPDLRYGARPVAYWVPAGAGVESGDLLAFCRARLAGFKVPVACHPVPSLPRNSLGKLQRRVLIARAAGELERDGK